MVRRRRAMTMVAALIMGAAIRPRPVFVKVVEAVWIKLDRRHSGVRHLAQARNYTLDRGYGFRARPLRSRPGMTGRSDSTARELPGSRRRPFRCSNRAPQPFGDLRDHVAE